MFDNNDDNSDVNELGLVEPKEPMYFAAKKAEDTANILLQKANAWFTTLDANGYLDKLRTMWMAYHGMYFSSFSESHQINFSGEQGELSNLAVNHLRNVAQHILVYVTSTRLNFKAKAVNTDQKSLTQTYLANGLLEYYLREKRLENYLRQAVEYAVVFGSGYIKMEWNAQSGDAYDYNEELATEIRPGDLEFSNLSPFDVVFDPNRDDDNHDWILCRSFKNKHDYVAKFPEYKDEIEALPTKSDLEGFVKDMGAYDETDLIPVYEFYHKRTESMPNGRYVLFLSDDVILLDENMPYRSLPVYKISAGKILGTPFGYTNLFDVLPIQDSINSLYSTMMTNLSTFGVQSVLVPKGGDIQVSDIQGGLNFIEYDESKGEVRPLQLTQSPPELFKALELLVKEIETQSGVNAASRGNPDPQLRSGNALALVQSMTIQFMSGLQQSYVAMSEDLGTGIINTLKDYASVPRISMIVGKTNRPYMKEFTGDDLKSINRVIVELANPLANTSAGRAEMASQMIQMGAIKSAREYLSVINTGNLDVFTEDDQHELFQIRDENERLAEGDAVVAVFTDDHAAHIKAHKTVFSDPSLRLDPALFQQVANHIQEHVDLWMQYSQQNPGLLMALGQQPIPMAQPMMPGPQGQPPMGPGGGAAPLPAPQEQADPMALTQGQGLPSPATPPEVNGEVPPSTPAENLAKLGVQ